MCAKRTRAGLKSRKIVFSDDFYSDLSAPEMLHARIIRSPFSYGKISSINFPDKEKIPENYFLFSNDDIPGRKFIETFGQRTSVFCDGNIKYKGEPVAILAGTDKKKLQELSEKIEINLDRSDFTKIEAEFRNSYERLATSPYDGTKNRGICSKPSLRSTSGTLNFGEESKEIVAKKEISIGNAEEFLQKETEEYTITKGKWHNEIILHTNRETEGCFCYVKGENLYIFSPGHWISHLREEVSAVTGFSTDNIFINRTVPGNETSNSLWMNGLIACQACIVAIKTGKPVMLSLSRQEQLDFIENPAEIEIYHKTAVSKNGLIKAMDISIEVDSGSSNPFSAEIIDRFLISSSGIYNTENLRIRTKLYTSRKPPASINFSTLDSHVFFAVENQIQKICNETGLSPMKFRLQNLRSENSRKTNVPFTMSFGRAADSIAAVCDLSDFNRKYAVYRYAMNKRFEQNEISPFSPPLRGIGLSSAFEGIGFLGTNLNASSFSLQVTLAEDGKLFVNAIPPSNSTKEVWTKIITDNLDIEAKNIVFGYSDLENDEKKNSFIPDDFVSNTNIKMHLLLKCVEAIKRRKSQVLPYTVTKNLSPARRSLWNKKEFSGAPYFSASFGTCVVEVEFDPCIFREKINSVYVIVDCGRVLNPTVALNTVKQSVKNCLATLVEYEHLECPKIQVKFAQSDDEPKPLGYIIHSILPAAFTAALSQAMAKQLDYLPIQTDSLFKIRQNEVLNENSCDS